MKRLSGVAAAITVVAERRGEAPLLSAKMLVDDDVYDEAGNCVGLIEDLLVDPHTGCVSYVVVALGGFLGLRRDRVPARGV